MTRVLAILTVRNEGAFLLEWLAHHKATGFTDFLVFSNDCDDGTDRILDRLDALGHLCHVANPAPHTKGPQWDALRTAATHPTLEQADWAMVLDVDEFVNIHVGDHTLSALFAALPEATAIPLTWRLFGNCGVVNYADKPVTDTFRHAAPRTLVWPWRASMFKTLFRLDGTYRKLGVHRPRDPDPDRIAGARWFDGSGRRLDPAFHTARVFSQPGQNNTGLAQLNHYPLGAMESYIVKLDRGRANRETAPLGMDYWCERNWCSERDDSIAALAPARDAILSALKADPELGPLHDAAVAWRHQRFAELMQDETCRQLFGRLVMTPPAREIPAPVLRHIFAIANKTAKPAD